MSFSSHLFDVPGIIPTSMRIVKSNSHFWFKIETFFFFFWSFSDWIRTDNPYYKLNIFAILMKVAILYLSIFSKAFSKDTTSLLVYEDCQNKIP